MSKATVTSYLKEADTECRNLIENAEQEVRDFIKDYQSRFDQSVNGNIYATFGEYLYNALGKKINPQPKSMLLNEWKKTHTSSVTKTDEKGETIPLNDEEIFNNIMKSNRERNRWASQQHKNYTITHAATGRKFGMGYVTEGGQIRSIDIPPERLFFYLTQEHVDIITNKQKRACAQDFLTFRDNYILIRDELLNKGEFKVKVKADVATFKDVSVKNSIRKGYHDTTDKYLVYDNTTKFDINLIEICMLNVAKFRRSDKLSELIKTDNKSLKDSFQGICDEPHAIRINLFNKDDKNGLTYFGSVDIQEKNSLTPLNAEKIKTDHTVCYFTSDDTASYNVRNFSPVTKSIHQLNMADGYTLNWVDILNNEDILKSIDQRIKFFEAASKTLHHLKTKHAALVFINGVF